MWKKDFELNAHEKEIERERCGEWGRGKREAAS